jgi:hypothetical protein
MDSARHEVKENCEDEKKIDGTAREKKKLRVSRMGITDVIEGRMRDEVLIEVKAKSNCYDSQKGVDE